MFPCMQIILQHRQQLRNQFESDMSDHGHFGSNVGPRRTAEQVGS